MKAGLKTWSIVLLALALPIGIVFSPAAPGNQANGTGWTLDRKQVLRSCVGSNSDQCGHPVFISFNVFSSREASWLKDLAAPLRELPPPLTSVLYLASRQNPETCPQKELSDFVFAATHPQKPSDNVAGRIVAVPQNIGRCFQASMQREAQYFLLLSAGEIPGYIMCEPDSRNKPLCKITLSRMTYRNGEAIEDRISFSAFSVTEVSELIGNFPALSIEPASDLQARFSASLEWAGMLFDSLPGWKSYYFGIP